LIKDIVSESAATYISVLQNAEKPRAETQSAKDDASFEPSTAFSLARFIPLLKERITVLNPFTRMFLVSWITLLDSIPDLELVAYLPSFLGGLFKFLSDSNQDVHTATHVCLEKFLSEIKKIARLKRGIAISKRSQADEGMRRSESSPAHSERSPRSAVDTGSERIARPRGGAAGSDSESEETESSTINDDISGDGEEDWIPGQDVQVDHVKILDILVTFLGGSSGKDLSSPTHKQHPVTRTEEEIQLTALRWIDSFFDICPEDILSFVPRLLSQVLPAMSNDVEQVRQAASRVNTSLMGYILSLPEDEAKAEGLQAIQSAPSLIPTAAGTAGSAVDRRESTLSVRTTRTAGRETPVSIASIDRAPQTDGAVASVAPDSRPTSRQTWNLDYEGTVNALTLQFLNEHEATRVAALNWLIMLQRKAPPGRKVSQSIHEFEDTSTKSSSSSRSTTGHFPRFSKPSPTCQMP
jgi:vacuole morphology and inheritance protein 14